MGKPAMVEDRCSAQGARGTRTADQIGDRSQPRACRCPFEEQFGAVMKEKSSRCACSRFDETKVRAGHEIIDIFDKGWGVGPAHEKNPPAHEAC